MGCVASKLEEEEEVVSICRERKRLLKLAVEKRYALAVAHCKYFHSLNAVAAAIKLFVARHSSPSSPFLITFPPPCPSSHSPSPPSENVITNPMFLQQTPSETKHEAIACDSCISSTSSDSSEEETEEKREGESERKGEEPQHEQPCGYYCMPVTMPMSMSMSMPVPMPMPPSMPSPQRDFGWDFFYPFDSLRSDMCGYHRNSDDDLRAVREEEGIPELEEEVEREEVEHKVVTVEENNNNNNNNKSNSEGVAEQVISGVETVKVVDVATENQGEQRGLAVLDTPAEGRELLEALKDIEDHFLRAYDSGKDVTRMLEANRIPLHSSLDEIKESSTKLIQAITWKSISSRQSSCKSLMAPNTKNSSTWVEYKNDLFDDYEGMDSGSHLSTLGRLYAWEKKLYEEVKAGDSTRKSYEKKCAQLRSKNVRGDDLLSTDKTKVEVKDLYAGILVAIRRAESISKRIEKMRDEELQPQIVELLKGLTQSWKIMLESHETQKKILSEVKYFTCTTYEKFCNQSHGFATLQLEAQLRNWRDCFKEYTAAQEAYVEALHGWLSKFIVPEVEFYSRSKNVALPYEVNGPPLLVICNDWLASMQKLPDKMVTLALKSVVKDVRALWLQQNKEQQQKRKVDRLTRVLDRRYSSGGLPKVETKMLELHATDHESKWSTTDEQDECMMEKNDHVETLRRKLEVEKEKHHSSMQETQRITLHGLQSGFSLVFESLSEFSKASQKMYNDLVSYSEKSDKVGNITYIEGDCNIESCNSQK
ncbi:nitrate regulatory gene2 protein isoform X1 [Vigna radiata var. radiata]|uniref:Nitrate regulatory gene2 protein isoform X1 n=1 Tax=Vigna radiata var. radiata TaxID=3916 RepID=A0A1S3V3C2_VIGRR|nr:nitrate regulatory gene2 protein isoform X1 [Vigna radiata var. radiata]XP_022641510.1 nitrate regulatory gene2 protein isoform X1 [Vigna radiata var. radiata]